MTDGAGPEDHSASGGHPTPRRPAARCDITADLRQILASVTGRAEMLDIPADLPLFGAGVGLDSLAGTLLLRRVQRRYGVDVAAEDLNLDALETLETLAAFIAARL